MNQLEKKASLVAITVIASAGVSSAAVTWTGGAAGNWKTASNWDSNAIPVNGDEVIIPSSSVVTYDGGGNLPFGITLDLDGTLTSSDPIRMNGATITVGATGTIAGGFWDLDDATISFADGAAYTADFWENKDVNSFAFELGMSGFSTLTPGSFLVGGGVTHNPGSIANATYIADMAGYSGGTGVITLVDYASDSAGMTNAFFQTATLSVTNAGSYVANLQWNDTTEAVELNITSIPEPSSVALLSLGLLLARRRR